MKFKLNCSQEEFVNHLRELTFEGSVILYNSPLRILYLISSMNKKPFLGYVFESEFHTTKKSFFRFGMHVLQGAFRCENGKCILHINLRFSKLLLIFYTLWFVVVFGFSFYLLVNQDYQVLLCFSFLVSLFCLFLGYKAIT